MISKNCLLIVLSIWGILLIIPGIMFIIERGEEKVKYTIIDVDGVSYETSDYVKIGECIKFKSLSTNETVEICGTYQIKENIKNINY